MNRTMKVLRTLIIATLLLIAMRAPGYPPAPAHPAEFQLKAELPQFWDLVDRDAKLRVVGTGFGFTEGPVWDQAGFLYVSDETINKIYRLHPDDRGSTMLKNGASKLSSLNYGWRNSDCGWARLRSSYSVTMCTGCFMRPRGGLCGRRCRKQQCLPGISITSR